MFDCPEQYQTSPTSTSLNVIVFDLPETVISIGVELVLSPSRLTSHFPRASAVAFPVIEPVFTVTVSPGSAQPQIGVFACRCRTIWSPRIDGNLKPVAGFFMGGSVIDGGGLV